MKRALLILPLLAISMSLSSFDSHKPANTAVNIPFQGSPSPLEIGSALKQALQQGTSKSTNLLSAVNGYFGNPAVKIVFPPEAQKAEKVLRSMGLGKLCDNVILSLNRAAENAAKDAEPIFLDAIKKMSISDVSGVLMGPNNSATIYFQKTTTTTLAAKFKPTIQASLAKVNATKYWAQAAGEYNKLPFVKHLNPDIADYATQKAIDGLFVMIAKEELNIRKNISARSTPVMQKVFSFASKVVH